MLEIDLDNAEKQAQKSLDISEEAFQRREAVRKEVKELEKENKKLKTNLEELIQADEMIKESLDRKERLYKFREQAEKELQQTLQKVIEAKSPSQAQKKEHKSLFGSSTPINQKENARPSFLSQSKYSSTGTAQ